MLAWGRVVPTEGPWVLPTQVSVQKYPDSVHVGDLATSIHGL